jgi:hypothetical protein
MDQWHDGTRDVGVHHRLCGAAAANSFLPQTRARWQRWRRFDVRMQLSERTKDNRDASNMLLNQLAQVIFVSSPVALEIVRYAHSHLGGGKLTSPQGPARQPDWSERLPLSPNPGADG